MREPRTAIVHYWLLQMRGGEKVVESLCRLLPHADIFTLFYDPEKVSPVIRSHRVTSSFLNPLRRGYRSLLPVMPLALESFDLRGYDLILSSESGPAKAVIAPSAARHICYCHTPMRYLWELYPDYLREWMPAWKRALIAPAAGFLRLWDFASAARVDDFLANSQNVRRRIWKTYRRDSEVVYPPVDVDSFYWKEPHDYYLIVSELVRYKRLDLAVTFFSNSGRRLKVVGTGPELGRLRRMAGRNVEFCGHVEEDELRLLYARCRALVLPGEEDFGLTPVEALASGKPVIALGRGGVLESVPAEGGFFFPDPHEDSLAEAVTRFEAAAFRIDPAALQRSVRRFAEPRFHEAMAGVIEGRARHAALRA